MVEIWRDILGYDGDYEISNLGRIRSFKRYETGRVLKPSTSRGYKSVTLYLPNGALKCPTVSRLVAQAFIPNPKNKPEVNHKNGIKTDDRVENLEWCTRIENIQHAFQNGLMSNRRGEKQGSSKLTSHQVGRIKLMLELGSSVRKIAKLFDVNHTTIWAIKHSLIWKHV